MAGGPDEVVVTSNPPGAYIYVDGKVVGQTPMLVELNRRSSLGDIRLYYPGFRVVQAHRYHYLNWWVFMNFFVGMIPAVVDFATGNWERMEDDPISAKLEPGDEPPPYGLQPTMPQPEQAPQ